MCTVLHLERQERRYNLNGNLMHAELINHSDLITLNGSNVSSIEVLKVGIIRDRGLEITSEMLDDFIVNYESGVYGTDIQVNLGHDRDGEAAGWVKSLRREGDTLLAEVEWTPLGVTKIKAKQYRFTSSELALSYPDANTGKKIKNVFIGVALTNTPAVKGMAPVQLSENLQIFLNSQNNMAKIQEDHKDLMEKDKITKADLAAFTKKHGDDEAHAKLCSKLEDKLDKQSEKDLAEKADKEEAKEAPKKEDDLADKAPAKKLDDKRDAKKGETEEEGKGGKYDGDDDEDDQKASAKGKVEKASEQVETVRLAEVVKLREELAAERRKREELSEKIETQELSEIIDKTLMFAENKSIGFRSETKSELLSFMRSLEQSQRDVFLSLMENVVSVEFGEKGSLNAGKVERLSEEEAEAKAIKLAEKYVGEGMAPIAAQKKAMAEVGLYL